MWLAVLPGRFQSQVLTASPVNHPEEVVVGARHHDAADRRDQHGFQDARLQASVPAGQRHSPVLPIPATFKLIKDAVVLIEGTQLTPEIFMHLLNRTNVTVISSRRQFTMERVKLCPPVETHDAS